MTKPKEYGVLFSPEMVIANLEGRKTQTRRTRGLDIINKDPDAWEFLGFRATDHHAIFQTLAKPDPTVRQLRVAIYLLEDRAVALEMERYCSEAT